MISFIKHKLYYSFLYSDINLQLPVIITLQFIEQIDNNNEVKWNFLEISLSDDCDERVCSFDKNTIDTVTTLESLIETLRK